MIRIEYATTGRFSRKEIIISKPLTVSGVSKDRETRFCRAAGCKAKGYRLHVLYNAGGERFFANAASFGGGLGQLPAWVRTPQRVSAWVGCKLLIDAVRREKKQRLTA